jgi:hypothetical protein
MGTPCHTPVNLEDEWRLRAVKLDDLRVKRMYRGAHGEELSTPTPVLLFGNSLNC